MYTASASTCFRLCLPIYEASYKNNRQTGQDPFESDDNDGQTASNTQVLAKPKKPALYKVLMLNDDFTPMEFVVHVLQRFFSKSLEEATAIMLQVHIRGVGLCGVYTYEVAETKVIQVKEFGLVNQHPLQCTLEKE